MQKAASDKLFHFVVDKDEKSTVIEDKYFAVWRESWNKKGCEVRDVGGTFVRADEYSEKCSKTVIQVLELGLEDYKTGAKNADFCEERFHCTVLKILCKIFHPYGANVLTVIFFSPAVVLYHVKKATLNCEKLNAVTITSPVISDC